LNKWGFSRVFQGVEKPVWRPRKSAIRRPYFGRESPDFFASVTQGHGPKWQTAGELLERERQQFHIFAGEAILAREVCGNFGSPISFIAQSWIG
jgi:hypothetical protein